MIDQGNGLADLLDDYPKLEKADLYAALLYASEVVGEEKIYAIQAG